MILKKELVFLSMVTMEIGKIQFFTYHGNGCYEQKKLHQKLESYRYKLPLKKVQGEIKHRNLKIAYFQKKVAKDKSITILLFI